MTSTEADSLWAPWALVGTWKPCATRKATSEHQKTALRTTAEPMPWVPRAKPASAPRTPDWVSSRYPSAVPGAVPPGETWLRARVDRLIRNRRSRRGPPWGSTAWVSWV